MSRERARWEVGRQRREEEELLKLLQSDHDDDADGQTEDDGEQPEDDANASSSESESSCDDEIANAMQTTTGKRFKYFVAFNRKSSAVGSVLKKVPFPDRPTFHLSREL